MFGGPPISGSVAADDATLLHCMVHVREGKFPGEYGTGACICLCVWVGVDVSVGVSVGLDMGVNVGADFQNATLLHCMVHVRAGKNPRRIWHGCVWV